MSSIRLWNRLSKSNSYLTKYIVKWNIQNFKNGSWESYMYGILGNLNMLECLNNGSECNMDNDMDNDMDNKCLDTMHYEWQENVHSKPKLRTFCLFKK